MSDDCRPEVLDRITLTIELTREVDLPNQWTSHCLELDVISAGKTPEVALEAVAEAVRMVTTWCVENAGDDSAKDAILRIIEEVSERRDRVSEGLDLIDQINKATNPAINAHKGTHRSKT
mgnify:CR=1 FL=1